MKTHVIVFARRGLKIIMIACFGYLNASAIEIGIPQLLCTDIKFSEGPAYHPDDYVVFSDVDGNVIYKWNAVTGLDTLAYPSGNANGIECTKNNDFYVCRTASRDVAKMTAAGSLTSVVSTYNGKKFNSPNDLTVGYLGSVYFTDPDFGVANRELSFQGVYCLPYNSSTLAVIDSTLTKPNGLTFVNDWRTLYVCESSTNTIYSYSLREEYKMSDPSKDKKVFLKLTGSGEIDGICSDVYGNIYVAFGEGGVMVYDKDAKQIGQISFPTKEKVRNLCFGGKYKNILDVTAGNSLYKVIIRFNGDFIAPGLLGVPTDKSIIFNALSDYPMNAYIKYGTSLTSLDSYTSTVHYVANAPFSINITGLQPSTHYYYQLCYKLDGDSAYKTGTAGEFNTQRAVGETFSFAVEADPHLDEGSDYRTYRNTLQNALNLKPDFMIDLGDNFLTEKFPICDKYYIEQRNLLYRNFWDKVCSSMPLFITIGNHEGELGWLGTNSATDIFNTATSVRKQYYPTPEPDDFYSGNSTVEPFVGKRQNYYSWTWGDALFVVIDPYAYTTTKPTEPWGFTLGKTQYDWFKKTLESSSSKFKFVFAHQLVGGDVLGRGGSEIADYYEHGGKNADGTYGFDAKRPGWGKPLHQLMEDNGVQMYFHGHDHFYAQQIKDGIIYQEVPQPSFPGYTVVNDAATYGYKSGEILPNSGHLNVKVSSDSVKVDYIGGYHVENKNIGWINGITRSTYSFSKSGLSGLNNVAVVNNHLTAYQSGESLVINSTETTLVDITLFSSTGQQLGLIYHGMIPQGDTRINIPSSYNSRLNIVNIQTPNYSISTKILN
jgi:sugar lactone lactonase YvrE